MSDRRKLSPPISLSARGERTIDAPISELISVALARPELISLAAGLVDPQTLPIDECAAITQRIFSDRARAQAALQYDTTHGLPALRKLCLAHIENLEGKSAADLGMSADDLVITTGSQQMLFLAADVLLDPGDIVIAANPSYFVFAGALQSMGARVIGVPVDDDGMNVDAVERALARLSASGKLSRVKFIYCVSYFDNPTGRSLSPRRRRCLLEIVRKYSRRHRILILEDAAYRELRYEGEDAPSIRSLDPANEFVLLTQTFSKPFAPGIKLGYSALPRGLLSPILGQKGNHDFGSSSLCQHIALESLRDGSYHRHLETLKRGYIRKRDAMLAALERHMPKARGLSWVHPHGGLYVWLTLPEKIQTSRTSAMFERCVERGVLYVPGELAFCPDKAGRLPMNHIRLSFGHVALEKIEPAIERLAGVVRELLAGRAAVKLRKVK